MPYLFQKNLIKKMFSLFILWHSLGPTEILKVLKELNTWVIFLKNLLGMLNINFYRTVNYSKHNIQKPTFVQSITDSTIYYHSIPIAYRIILYINI